MEIEVSEQVPLSTDDRIKVNTCLHVQCKVLMCMHVCTYKCSCVCMCVHTYVWHCTAIQAAPHRESTPYHPSSSEISIHSSSSFG